MKKNEMAQETKFQKREQFAAEAMEVIETVCTMLACVILYLYVAGGFGLLHTPAANPDEIVMPIARVFVIIQNDMVQFSEVICSNSMAASLAAVILIIAAAMASSIRSDILFSEARRQLHSNR